MSCCSTQRLFAARGRPYRCCWNVKGQSRRQARIGYIAWWSVRPVSCAVSHWPSWRASIRWDQKQNKLGGQTNADPAPMTHQLQCGKLFNVTFACRSESLTWRPTLSCLLPFNWMRGYLRTSLWKRSKKRGKGLSAECNQIRAHIPNTAFFREILWLCRKAKEEKQDFKIKSRLFSRFQEKEAETHTQIKEREKD